MSFSLKKKELIQKINILFIGGGWKELAELYEFASKLPTKEKTFIAMALFQEGSSEEAKKIINDELSRYRKSNSSNVANLPEHRKLIERLLLSGCYQTLSKMNRLLGNIETARKQQNQSIELSVEASLRNLAYKSRLNDEKPCREHHYSNTLSFDNVPNATQVEILSRVSLGNAWASNTINTVIFRHHAVITFNGKQYTAFYLNENTIRVIKRDLESESLEFYDLDGLYNINDAHNCIVLGYDREGCIHISYDHHASRLKYRKSLASESINEWTDEIHMTGRYENVITYPTFVNPRGDFPLTLIYRHGTHDRGAAYIKTFNETDGCWTDHPHPILSGNESKPWTSNAYWNHPAVGKNNDLFLSFVWRNSVVGSGEGINNVDMGFAQSFDNGYSWLTSNLELYRIPITQVSSEVIYATSPCSNLINQTSMAVDSKNYAHVAFYSNDPDGVPQYQHLWFNGKKWNHQYVSSRNKKFELEGKGTLQIDISRPEILLTASDDVIIIFRTKELGNRLSYVYLKSPNYHWHGEAATLLDFDIGYSEPILDRERWFEEEILSLYVQRTEQPNHDEIVTETSQPAYMFDLKITEM